MLLCSDATPLWCSMYPVQHCFPAPTAPVAHSTLHLRGLENDCSSSSPSSIQNFQMRPPQCKPLSVQGARAATAEGWLPPPAHLAVGVPPAPEFPSDQSRVGACVPSPLKAWQCCCIQGAAGGSSWYCTLLLTCRIKWAEVDGKLLWYWAEIWLCWQDGGKDLIFASLNPKQVIPNKEKMIGLQVKTRGK